LKFNLRRNCLSQIHHVFDVDITVH
jgi:hypothetical protein